uniref:Reverse transcriptase Ty1/copia-type domain-containing protein n=1 Tax=Physcomitrium patens TaxID=3218 RepID=A0A2K1JWC4_PHYPA|nr:hypothetical protein PHYPA_015606 [Physcomitrium patens]
MKIPLRFKQQGSKGKTLTVLINPKNKLQKETNTFAVDPKSYQSLTEGLLYFTITRWDIQYTVRCLSRYMKNLQIAHIVAVRNVLRYLKRIAGLWKLPSSKQRWRITQLCGCGLDRAASNSSIEAGAFNIALMSLDRHGFTQFRQRIVTVVALDEEELKCIAKSRTESTEPLSPLEDPPPRPSYLIDSDSAGLPEERSSLATIHFVSVSLIDGAALRMGEPDLLDPTPYHLIVKIQTVHLERGELPQHIEELNCASH